MISVFTNITNFTVMMKLYLFNPENDIALVHGRRRFTMSPHVARLHRDGALLPMWYAGEEDAVLGACEDNAWLDSVRRSFGLRVCAVSSVEKVAYMGVPWGWSYDAARILSDAGALVISDDSVERIARLSHRRISVRVMERLHAMLPFRLPRVPVEVNDVDILRQIVAEYPVYVKAPWSSSGRGVFRVASFDEKVVARVNGILRRQGSILVEESLDKKRDFAMLFHSAHGCVQWIGYSLFFNAVGDAYGGNILAADDEIEDMLVCDGASRAHLHAIRKVLPSVLAEIIGDTYEGYFGVDMLVASDGMIDPCVEVNLRMTMGVVAHALMSRYMSRESRGVFRVVRGLPDCGDAPVVDDCRLVSGRVHLTPSSVDGFNFIMEASGQSKVDRHL